MKFIFKARNKNGELKEGTINATSSEIAIELLQKNELFPLSINSERNSDSIEEIFSKYFDRIDAKELMIFFRQLAILVEAKVPIVVALSAIKEQMENKYFQKVIAEITSDVQDGLSLSDAMKKQEGIFSNLTINIIRSGETSGNLKKSVEYIAGNIEKNYNLVSKVKSAMTYPIIVMSVFFVIAFIVISFVVPKLTTMIKEMGPEVVVPWYTQAIISLSDFMANYWWAVGVIILALIGSTIYYVRTEDGKKEWDQVKIKLPIFGKMYQYLYIARFSENLAILLASGIPIIKALNIVSSVVSNIVYEAIFLKAAEEIRIGGTMSSVLHRSPQIPPIVSQMVKIGEESGQIDLVLTYVSRFYEQELENMTKNLTTLIEPILMVIIGIAVAFLAFSIIMPIYNIAGQM